MFIRIVKMNFKESNIALFLENFNQNKEKIRNFKGCSLLELYRDKNDTNTFFTYSYWESEADLEAYRNSELFKVVWGKAKVLFNNKAEAWSVDKVQSLT
ncbi:MAG: antibiotic biosynthesis monooxygenase family protein [Lutibacter sp.]|nr:antibiotic biosynthesis monooxygenase family protein [Lutibacter sp.]